MKIGVPSEVKDNEFRVAITPAGVHELARAGHRVFVEAGAGAGSSLPDDDFAAAGATVLRAADDVWSEAELVLKVEEPVPGEYHRLRPGQVLFAYLHLAASRKCTEELLARGVTAIGYETVRLPAGTLPLLAPMSQVAGRMAVQAGARHRERDGGPGAGLGTGLLPGSRPAQVVVLGAGAAGRSAAAAALAMRAEVVLTDASPARLRRAAARFHGRCRTVAPDGRGFERAMLAADLVIGAVLVPGAKTPTVVSRDLAARLRPGTVLVDVSIDQGGCFADSRPTTHADPVYRAHGSLFYCVANMPGAVPHTSTYALTGATLPYALAIANRGWRGALRNDDALAHGLQVHAGTLTCPPVAEAHGLGHAPVPAVLA